jgi:hypothetical protein
METNQRKVGRPKVPPRTGPLVLGDDRGRTKVTLEITESAADELVQYSRWVAECSGLSAIEAKFKTVDFALREVFRRDRVWQAKPCGVPEPEPAKAAPVTTPSSARPGPATPPSLPPSMARASVDGGRS